MKTISQVAKITGISTRTLQYYDEIALLKPSTLTASGYRLYDDAALEKLQEILFFKELGFKLMDIKEILENPNYDRIQAFKKQKELLLLKRKRTDRLIHLLERLEKGEKCMSFKEFDLSDYLSALERFKVKNESAIIKYWGSIENFNRFMQKIKDNEENVAQLAIKQFGSIEKYTEAMKYNLEHFSEIMEQKMSEVPKEMLQKDLYAKLTADISKDVSSAEIQQIVQEILDNAASVNSSNTSLLGNNYCAMIIDVYSNDYLKQSYDTRQGKGASDYIVKAFQYYADHSN